jgi:hypothetical protein
MRIRSTWIAVAVAAAFIASGCGSIVDPANNQTQTFTGTITTGSNSVNAFNVSKSGEYSVTFISLSPPAQAIAFFTIFLGQNSAQGCAPVQQNNLSKPGQTVLNSSIVPGSYCVGIADPNLAIATSAIYTLQVQHP